MHPAYVLMRFCHLIILSFVCKVKEGRNIGMLFSVYNKRMYTLFSILNIKMRVRKSHSGPPREILQGGTRLLWGPGNNLRFLYTLWI